MSTEVLYAFVFATFGHPIVRAVLGLLAANVLVGIAASLYTRSFRLGAVGDWLLTRAIPYLLGAATVQLVLLAVPQEWSGIGQAAATAVWLFVCAALVGKVLDMLRELGIPIPETLTDTKKPEVTAGP